jgi:flagellar motility protein MotE (MotC chaperone)
MAKNIMTFKKCALLFLFVSVSISAMDRFIESITNCFRSEQSRELARMNQEMRKRIAELDSMQVENHKILKDLAVKQKRLDEIHKENEALLNNSKDLERQMTSGRQIQ